jgi:hypothetical protein
MASTVALLYVQIPSFSTNNIVSEVFTGVVSSGNSGSGTQPEKRNIPNKK